MDLDKVKRLFWAVVSFMMVSDTSKARLDPIMECPNCGENMPHSYLLRTHPKKCKGEPSLRGLVTLSQQHAQLSAAGPAAKHPVPQVQHDDDATDMVLDPPDSDVPPAAPSQPAEAADIPHAVLQAPPNLPVKLTDAERLQHSIEDFVLQHVQGVKDVALQTSWNAETNL